MRIDSSGNLLVGTTSTGAATASNGAYITPDGQIIGRSDGIVSYLNRRSTDGQILQFMKDGTTVGSIGVSAGNNIAIGSTSGSHAGITFGTNTVAPMNVSNFTNADDAYDLGNTSARWQDLYLSGGVYLGGTGSANHLDDYEEGTWTPSLSGSSYVSGGVKYGFYTKVGNLVTATAVFDNTTITGGASTKITGLPFTVSAEGSQTRFPAFSSHAAGSATSGTTIGGGYAEQSTTNLILLQNNSTVTVTLVNGTLFIFITVIYRT